MTIEIIKGLFAKMRNKEELFKSLKELDWALEILGYGLIPPQHQYINSNGNNLQNVLILYEYILSGKVSVDYEGKAIEFHNVEVD